MPRNMGWKVVDRLFLVAFGVHDPTDEEWVYYLQDVERHGIVGTRQLISTDGGGPNATQRRYLNELLAGRSVPVAVMSRSMVIRGVLTVLSWFNRKLAAFSPAELRDALAFLEIPASRADLIEREMLRLRLSLDDDERATS